MEQVEDKLIAWLNMDFEERQKYNGYSGFCKGILFKNDNQFMREDKERLKRRVERERKIVKENKARKNKK